MMDDSRTRMLLGDGVDRLRRSRVAVFGLGGVGSYCVEALARAGIGALDLFDGDVVSDSNRNRQLYALASTVGRAKTDVARERVAEIDEGCSVAVTNAFLHAEEIEGLWQNWDFVVDAVDTVSVKTELARVAESRGTRIVSVMGSGNKLHAAFRVSDIYETANCPLARAMRQTLRKAGVKSLTVVWSADESVRTVVDDRGRHAPGSISYVPAMAGLTAAEYVITRLTEEKL